ncbi:MAG: Gfo/Idh/MocA family protein, partial [Halobacteriaceae archaeon]
IDERYAVGVIGSGHIAIHYHLPVLKHLNATSVAFVADVDSGACKRAASVYDTTDHVITDTSALPECDIVLLALPVADREPYFEEFGERGTAIFSEKPFALDQSMHEAFLNAAEAVTCNYTRMEYGSSEQMASLIESRVFGQPEHIVIRRGNPQTSTGKEESQTNPHRRGGLLHERGTHLFSQLLWLLKEFDFSVDDAKISWNEGLDIDVNANISAAANGEQIPVDFEYSLVKRLDREIRVKFENASVWYDPSEPDAQLEFSPGAHPSKRMKFTHDERAPRNHHQAIAARWIRFLSTLETGDYETRFQTGVQVSKIITEIYDTVDRWPGES